MELLRADCGSQYAELVFARLVFQYLSHARPLCVQIITIPDYRKQLIGIGLSLRVGNYANCFSCYLLGLLELEEGSSMKLEHCLIEVELLN